jgi:hypothetical protein
MARIGKDHDRASATADPRAHVCCAHRHPTTTCHHTHQVDCTAYLRLRWGLTRPCRWAGTVSAAFPPEPTTLIASRLSYLKARRSQAHGHLHALLHLCSHPAVSTLLAMVRAVCVPCCSGVVQALQQGLLTASLLHRHCNLIPRHHSICMPATNWRFAVDQIIAMYLTCAWLTS